VDFSEDERVEIPEEMPMLPVRDVVVFPYMILPLFVARESSIKAVDEALANDRLVFLAAQKDLSEENPTDQSIYNIGTVAMIMRMRKLPDGRVKILVQGLVKANIEKYLQQEPSFQVRISKLDDKKVTAPTVEIEAFMRIVKENLEKIISLGKVLSPDILMILEDIGDPGRLSDLIASNLGLKVEESQEIMGLVDPFVRLKKVNEHLTRELELLDVQARIQTQAKEEMSRTQREYYLREQLRAIKSELGDVDLRVEEINELEEKITKCKMPLETDLEARKQLRRLDQMHPDAAEASIVRTYVEWLIEIPWSRSTRDNLDLNKAMQVLNEDHYNLEKIKERIIEYLAVRKLKKSMKGPILCFLGPPGVGKTSLGKSIARAMDRKFVRVSLGGLRDEAEIRGHRRTYVGAMPGRIIQGLKQAGTNNPVFMLDELDKIGSDFRGDPASALLEVLDPEQNNSFRDHYLNLPYDLSNVFFITTANLIDPIPSALKDRLEVITLSGYSEEEKFHISNRFLISKQINENGISKKNIEFLKKGLKVIINQYTRESGLRELERQIGAICRKVARKIAEGKDFQVKVDATNVSEFLGPSKYLPEIESEETDIGVVTGLAWTPYGGDILHVEANVTKGNGKLTLTGQLGDVMKESATAALSYLRARAKNFKINEDIFSKSDFHIHVPAGAIPKDGPSAGITMCTALLSALTKKIVSPRMAMTGEITLNGRILPVGGLKEKILAAARLNFVTIIIPEKNQRDLKEIPDHIKRKIKFIPVKKIDEVFEAAFYVEKRKVDAKPPLANKRKKTTNLRKKPGPRGRNLTL